MSGTATEQVVLPAWAIVSDKRRQHIGRVVALLDRWAREMRIDQDEAQAWHDAGRWHDALRDADEGALRAMTGDTQRPVGLLHGPAAADRIRAEGETRGDVLDAIRYHTVGFASWSRTGRALYMADFLEPGRGFMQTDRAFLATQAPLAFDAVFRQVVRARIEWVLREGKAIPPEAVQLWNAVR